VVNYDVPMVPEDYVIVSAGRAAPGCRPCLHLVTPLDTPMVQRIEAVLRQKIERRKIAGLDYNAAAPPRPAPPVNRRHDRVR